jgi:hypothetical protein
MSYSATSLHELWSTLAVMQVHSRARAGLSLLAATRFATFGLYSGRDNDLDWPSQPLAGYARCERPSVHPRTTSSDDRSSLN